MIKIPNGLLLSITFLGAAAASTLSPAHQFLPEQAPNPISQPKDHSQPTNAVFAQPRPLLQQVKSDEALAALRDIEVQHPATKGLSHELGVAYYKKGDYFTAAKYLKKYREDNLE